MVLGPRAQGQAAEFARFTSLAIVLFGLHHRTAFEVNVLEVVVARAHLFLIQLGHLARVTDPIWYTSSMRIYVIGAGGLLAQMAYDLYSLSLIHI